MKLNFKKIEIHSFMSFEDEVFEFDKHCGMILIRGRNNDLPNNETNGSGKTAIFSALVYALFGETQSKIKKTENIVNKYVKDKDLRVILTFDIDGVQYKIIRGLNKGKTSYLELYDKDGNITKSSILETQNHIEKNIIKCDLSIFLRTVLLTSKQTYNFYDLKKSDKKEFIEKLFDISVFGDMCQAIHKDILSCDKSIASCQNKLMVLTRQDEEYKRRIDQYDAEHSKKISDTTSLIDNIKNKYDLVKKNYVQLNSSEILKVESAITKINEAKSKVCAMLSDLDRKKQQIDLSIHKLDNSKKTKQQMLDKHSEIISRLCEHCRSVYAEYSGISGFENEILALSEKIKAFNLKAEQTEAKKTELNDKLKILNDKLTIADQKMLQLTEEYNKTNSDLMLLESKMQTAESDLLRLQTEINPFTDLRQKNIKLIDDENKALTDLTDKYRYLKFAENIVSQETLRKFIISDLIGLLNNKIKTYLTSLGSKYTVIFDSDMDYDFVTSAGSYEFGNFSAGEAMRIMVATSFAFRDFMSIRNGLNANILILDEYFDSAISASCVESILKILKVYVNTCGQNVYCISHRPEVSVENFDSVIEIHKTDNISHIKYID